MKINDTRFPKPMFWDDNSTSEFISSNHAKKICILTWDSSEDIIFQQIRYAIDQDADIILSELLPHELPNKTLLSEYNFFVDKYQFKAPNIIIENEDNDNSQLLILSDSSEKTENNRVYSIILSKFKNQHNTKYVDLNNKEDIQNLCQFCAESSRFLINTRNIVLINLILSHCHKHDKSFSIIPDDSFDYLRYILQGCILSESVKFHNQQSSIRSKVLKSLHFSKINDYFAEYYDGANVFIRKDHIRKVFQYSNNYNISINKNEPRLSRYTASASFNYVSIRSGSSNYPQSNLNYTCGYVFQYADESNLNYRRIKLFRDLALKNTDKLEEIFQALYEYPFKNNQYKKFPFLHEFLLSTLIASNDPLLIDDERKKLINFGTKGFTNRYYRENHCDDYNLFVYLEDPLSNFDEFKGKFKQCILKPGADFKSILQLLHIYPSFIDTELIISLFETENLYKNNRLLTNLMHGILYSYNLDIYDIYFDCFNEKSNKNYDSLNSFLSNSKVFSQIPPYLSNILGCFLKNQNFEINKDRLTTNEKFAISRIYYFRKDFKSIISLLSTIDIQMSDPESTFHFLFFNELWTELGLNGNSINFSKETFFKPNFSYSELANLSHYIKSKNISEHISLCRENESLNPFSFHHLLD